MSDRRPGDALRLDLAAALAGAPPLAFDEVGPCIPAATPSIPPR